MVQIREISGLDALDPAFRGTLLSFFSRRLREKATAEDLVQQVFERLVQRGDLASIEKIRGYVYRVAENVLADHMRAAAVRHGRAHDLFDEAIHAGIDFSPEYILTKRERLARVMAVLQALPERTRIIFVLRRVEGWRYQEIAKHCDISVSAVEKHVARAVAELAASEDDDV